MRKYEKLKVKRIMLRVVVVLKLKVSQGYGASCRSKYIQFVVQIYVADKLEGRP